MRVITAILKFSRRLYLAVRFFIALQYSWNLAWIKAERRSL